MKRYLPPDSCPQVHDLVALAADHASARDYERAIDLHGRALDILLETDARPGLVEGKAMLRNRRAELFVALGRFQQALGELDRVLAIRGDLKDPGLVIRALVVLAQIHAIYGEYGEALASLENARTLAEALGAPLELGRVLASLGALQARMGEHHAGGESLRQVLEILPESVQDSESALLRASALTQLGLAAFRERQAELARERYRQSLEILARWGPESELEAETWRLMGVLWSVRGRFSEALRHLRKALRMYLLNRMPLGRARVYNSLGQTCLEMGRLDDALLFLEKARWICEELGADAELAAIYGKLGAVHLNREDYLQAVELHRRDVAVCRRFGNSRALAFATRNLGLSLRARGDLSEARRCLEEALGSFLSLQDRALAMQVHLDLAEVWLDWGRLPEAEESLQRSRDELHSDSPDSDKARIWLLTGTLQRLRQRWSEAQEAYLEALRILAEAGPTGALARVRYELGQVHAEAQDHDQAVYHLHECLVLARQLGATHLARKAMRRLDRLDEVEVVNLLMEELEACQESESEAVLSVSP